MLVLIFPLFNLEMLAWFALIPLFFLIQEQPLVRVTWFGFWAGMVFYFFGLRWVTNTIVNYGNLPVIVSYLVLLLLAAYLSLYMALFCYLLKKWSRGNLLYFIFLAPGLWTSLEYLRSTHSQYGFSWLGLGYSQSGNLPVIQMAEITGVYGISTLIVFINASLFYLLNTWLTRRDSAPNKKQVAGVLGLSLAIGVFWIGYGQMALEKWENDPSSSKPLKVGLAQGNIQQHLKWNPLYQNQVVATYRKLSLEAAQSKPDLIVWPEAAIPFYYSLDKKNSALIKDIVQTTKTPLLLGSPYGEFENKKRILYNSAYLIDAAGETLGRYDKIHLVPFGEFVPFKKLLWFVSKMVEGIGDFGQGTEDKVFDLNGAKLAVSICYEITFPDLVRQPVLHGAQFLVNITNDAWFGDSPASYQHMDMAALRAVENRVPIVRAANTGITGTIDPTGAIRQATRLFEETVVITEIQPHQGETTFYTQNGDLFSQACILLIGLFGLLNFYANRVRFFRG
jgi:apolipoprotein N-acyltransferase